VGDAKMQKISAESVDKNGIETSEHKPYISRIGIGKRACVVLEPLLPTCQTALTFPDPISLAPYLEFTSSVPFQFDIYQ
jgi:hypothetical protein